MARDLRRWPRVDWHMTVTYTLLNSGRTSRALTQNISAGGLRFLIPYAIEPGMDFDMSLEVPERSKPVRMVGRAVWRRWRPSPDTSISLQGSEVGVKFLKISEEDQAFLRRSIKINRE